MIDLGTLSLTGDEDGFIRRRCPRCSEIFKRPVARINLGELLAPYCPYCGQASDGDWETSEQAAYQEATMERAAFKYVSEEFNKMLVGLQSDVLKVTPGTTDLPPDPGSPPVDSTDGFVQVDVPCHEDDPFKVGSNTSADVTCTVCGIPYPIADVAQLGAS